MTKSEHLRWLRKRGLAPDQLKIKRNAGSPYSIPCYKVESNVPLSNSIPANGTKSFDTSKAAFCNANYAMAPAYNKGPVMVVSKDELKAGAGRKM